METKRKPKPKQVKFLDAKVLIATTSLAVTLGMWNLFSHDALRAELAPSDPESAPPPQDTTGMDLPPLPTLAPLVTLPDLDTAQAAAPGAQAPAAYTPAGENQAASLPLRSVSAAGSPVIVQKFKPVVDTAVVSSGGRKSGGSQPVTETRSSR